MSQAESTTAKVLGVISSAVIIGAVIITVRLAQWAAIAKPSMPWGTVDMIFTFTIPWLIPTIMFVVGLVMIKSPFGKPVLLASILIFAWDINATFFYPAAGSQLRMVKRNADGYMIERAPQIETATFKNQGFLYRDKKTGEINPNAWFKTAMQAANETRDDGRRYKAVLARAADRDEVVARAEVLGTQSDWTTVAEIRVPTHIWVPVTDTITPMYRDKEKTNANGHYWDRIKHEQDLTVLMYERYQRLKVQQPQASFEQLRDEVYAECDTKHTCGNLDEMIGRLCDGSNGCRPGLPYGADVVVCAGPGFADGGALQVWRNGVAVYGRIPTTIDFSHSGWIGNAGAYRLTIEPDDPAHGQTFSKNVCLAHPGARIVRLAPVGNSMMATAINNY